MYIECPQCNGSIPTYTARCGDCGFDLVEYCNEFDAYLDAVNEQTPLEAYADVVNEPEHLFQHEDPFDHLDWTG